MPKYISTVAEANALIEAATNPQNQAAGHVVCLTRVGKHTYENNGNILRDEAIREELKTTEGNAGTAYIIADFGAAPGKKPWKRNDLMPEDVRVNEKVILQQLPPEDFDGYEPDPDQRRIKEEVRKFEDVKKADDLGDEEYDDTWKIP